MRIKLSKQNWRLVGQKMGWLKRAQIETNNVAGVKSTGAAGAMGIGKDKITPGSLDGNTGNVDEGKMKYNEQLRRDNGLNMEQEKTLHSIKYVNEYFESLLGLLERSNSSSRTQDLLEWAFPQLKNNLKPDSLDLILREYDHDIRYWRQKRQNGTPDQNTRYIKEWTRIASDRVVVVKKLQNVFNKFMASQPQIQIENTEGLNLDTGDVKL